MKIYKQFFIIKQYFARDRYNFHNFKILQYIYNDFN